MTDIRITERALHPLHSLISWPAVIGGAVVAITVGAMLNLLGLALGAAVFDPYNVEGNDLAGFSAGAGIWMLIANSIALFVGGAIASRAAKYPDHHKGFLHGLMVWALAFLLAILFATGTVAGGAAATTAGEAARVPAEETTVGDIAAPERDIDNEATLVPPLQQTQVARMAEGTATFALWGFLTMLAGAISAVLGGIYGQRRHKWMAIVGSPADGAAERL